MDKLSFDDAITLALGCHDYNGGHHDKEGAIYHHGIQTVINVLKSAKEQEPQMDLQISAIFAFGKREETLTASRAVEEDEVALLSEAREFLLHVRRQWDDNNLANKEAYVTKEEERDFHSNMRK